MEFKSSPGVLGNSGHILKSMLNMPSLTDLSKLTPPSFKPRQEARDYKDQVNPPKILDMKFRQMQYSKPMPTDEDLEAFRENHRQRMLRIEQRFLL